MDKAETRTFYEEHMYGRWRLGETVTYERLGPDPKKKPDAEGFGALFEAVGGELVKIKVSKDGKEAEFVIHAYLPEKEDAARYPEGSPFIVCMHPIMPKDHALKRGWACIFMDTREIASDDTKHIGAFYDLYPYGKKTEEQTGVLMAWAWGASKVLDAVIGGLGKELGLDPSASLVTGVSRWGKATAVCGAFDERFRMPVPACSGAGGLALYSFVSEGKTYDFSSIGGPADYTYTKNEPLDCLQSEAERGWFNDRFLEYRTPRDIPKDQENLPILAMSPERYYFIIAACMGEDWVNAPAMWECFKRADEVYRKAGLSDHLAVHFHKEGHAVIEEDMELIIGYFDHMYYGFDTGVDMKSLKTTVFA
ncbi:MAG: hypothetical protein J6Z46_01935 [Lachnospiraceae bacterium]|nr:hypothetical protein [Lachnospiraceae bacterium]